MRAAVGAACALVRAGRFRAEADLVAGRLGAALLVVVLVEVVDVVGVVDDVVELGAVLAGGVEVAVCEFVVCAKASADENKRNAPQESSAAETEWITNLCAGLSSSLLGRMVD